MDTLVIRIIVSLLLFGAVSLAMWAAAIFFESSFRDYEQRFVQSTSKTMSGMFIFMDPHKLFILNIAITVIFFLCGLILTRNILFLAIFGAVGFSLPRIWLWQIKKKRIEKFGEQLVDSLMVLSNGLRSGLSLVQSIEVLENEQDPPISQEFGLVLREVTLGVPIVEALKNLTQRIPNEDLMLMVASINIVIGTGGNLREIFDSMADVIRERSKIELKTKTLTSQGKLQGLVVGLLPLALGGIMFLMDPRMMNYMFKTAMGIFALAAMLALQVTGYLFIRKITTIEV